VQEVLNALNLWNFSGLRLPGADMRSRQTAETKERVLMGVVVTAQGGEGKKFEKPTEMIQQGVLADIVDQGMKPNKFKPGTMQHKAYFVWILEEKDSEGRNKRAFEFYTVSADKKANLRKRLTEFGAKFTAGPDGKELIDGQPSLELDKYIGVKRTIVLSVEDPREPGGEPFVKVLATQKPSGAGVDIPADFVRKQDQPAK
jgi:hypothetical protein